MDIPIEERYPHLAYPMKALQNMTGYLRALMARLRGLFSKRNDDRKFDEEIKTHLELLTERYLRQGMTQDEAEAAARRRFGNVTLLKEANREMRGIRFVDTVYQDTRYGLWMLKRNPGLTCVALLTLALGIGANTAIFSVVDAVLLRPFPYPESDRLVYVGLKRAQENDLGLAFRTDFLEWRERTKSFDQIGAYRSGGSVDLVERGERERLSPGLISSNLFATLGVAPALGRAFMAEEDTASGSPVVILSGSLWRRRFGGDPSVIGRALSFQRHERGRLFPGRAMVLTVVGVMPDGFRFPGQDFDLWLPLALNREDLVEVGVIARLRPESTLETANADLSVILEPKRQTVPEIYSEIQVRAIGLSEWLLNAVPREWFIVDIQRALLLLLGT